MAYVFVNKDGITYAGKKLNYGDSGIEGISEIAMINLARHPFIIKAYGISMNNEVLLLELYSISLHQYFITGDPEPSDFDRKVLLETAIGLNYLHQNNIVHQCINTDTVVLKRNGNNFQVIITEFSKAVILLDKEKSTVSGNYLPYMSPELLNESGVLSQAHDIYAFGILTLNLLSRKELKRDPERSVLLKALQEENDSRFISHRLKDFSLGDHSTWVEFIANCIAFNPNERLTMDKIVHHQLFSGDISKYRSILSYTPEYPKIEPYQKSDSVNNRFRESLKWMIGLLSNSFKHAHIGVLFWCFDLMHRYRHCLEDDNRVYQASMAVVMLVLKATGYSFKMSELLSDLKKKYSQATQDKILTMEESILEELQGNIIVRSLYDECSYLDDLFSLYDYIMKKEVIETYLFDTHTEFKNKLSNKGIRKNLVTIGVFFEK